ncbi:hypothetical protein KZ859_26075, partial [Pseudomonas aeruginosa]|nr:hypothetical protein [Pseudomonas aeruginosa]
MSKELNKAPVEQAGGDERVVDGKPRATKCPDCGEGDLMPGDLCACGYETDPAAGYACSECDGSGEGCVGEVCRECDGSGWFVTPEQARAAMAQPSPASDLDPLNLAPHAEAFNEAPAEALKPEPAEADRPEVVAWQYRVTAGPQTGWSLWHPGKGEEFERSYTVERRPLMTVAQHERIVGELRSDRDSWAEQVEQRLADWDEMRKERDAALAKIAELDQALAEKDPFGAKLNRISEKLERCDALLAARAAQAGQVPQAWLDVQAERRRQITAEGWTPEHDDLYCAAELPRAAAAYILNGA